MIMPRSTFPIALGALLVGALVLSFLQHGEIADLQVRLTAAERERDELRRRGADLQRRNGELATQLDRGPGGQEEAGSGLPGRRTLPLNGAPVTTPARGQENRVANMMNQPEVRQLMVNQQKAALDGRYAALFRKLGLSGEALEKFKNLLVDKQTVLSDVMMEARNQGINGRESRDELRKLVEQLQGEVDGNIRETLGEAAYAQYKNYETTMPQRSVATQLDQRLSYTSTPLQPSQVEQLVQILHDTAPAAGNRATATGFMTSAVALGSPAMTFVGGSPRITDAAIAQAQGVLSPAQLAALQALQQEQKAAAQLSEHLRNNRRPADTTVPPRGE